MTGHTTLHEGIQRKGDLPIRFTSCTVIVRREGFMSTSKELNPRSQKKPSQLGRFQNLNGLIKR